VRHTGRLLAPANILGLHDFVARTVANDGGRRFARLIFHFVGGTITSVLLLHDLLTRCDVGKRFDGAFVLDARWRRPTIAFVFDSRDRMTRIAGDGRMNRTNFRHAFEFGTTTAASTVRGDLDNLFAIRTLGNRFLGTRFTLDLALFTGYAANRVELVFADLDFIFTWFGRFVLLADGDFFATFSVNSFVLALVGLYHWAFVDVTNALPFWTLIVGYERGFVQRLASWHGSRFSATLTLDANRVISRVYSSIDDSVLANL